MPDADTKTTAQDEDLFAAIHRDILTLKGELSTRWARTPPDAASIATQITGSILPLMAQIVVRAGQLESGMSDMFVVHEQRIGDLESPVTQITGEDAEKLKGALEGTLFVIDLVLGMGNQKPDVVKRLEDLKVLATESLTIVDDATLEEDEDEDDDTEEHDDA